MQESLDDNQPTRVETLLRDAHLCRMRQRWADAEVLCLKALELAPDDAMGREMLGDLALERGDAAEALAQYRRAHALLPQRGVLEEKIARVVLLQAEEERERIEAQLLISNPGRRSERKRQGLVTLLLSLMLPGLGQLFRGEYIKGGILLAVGLLALFLGADEFLKMTMALSGSLPRGERVNDLLAGIGLLGLLAYLYSLLDAAATSGKSDRLAGG